MIIEALAIAIGKALTVKLFTIYLSSSFSTQHVSIDGAPKWYYKEGKNELASFAMTKGGIASIDTAQKIATKKMEGKIETIIQTVLYDFYKKSKTDQEKELISKFEKDPYLPLFVKKNLKFTHIDYEKKIDTSFVKASLDKRTLIDYQKERLEKITKAILSQKADDAFDELENRPEEFLEEVGAGN